MSGAVRPVLSTQELRAQGPYACALCCRQLGME
jgi:hypothetical protein